MTCLTRQRVRYDHGSRLTWETRNEMKTRFTTHCDYSGSLSALFLTIILQYILPRPCESSLGPLWLTIQMPACPR